MNFSRAKMSGLFSFGVSLAVSPSAAPRSRTTYHCSFLAPDAASSASAPFGLNSYSELFEFFRSELLNTMRMTSSPS